MTPNLLLPVRGIIAGVLTVATLTSCTAAPLKQTEKSMKWMEHTRTLCIGRFVVNMPVDFKMLTQSYYSNGDDITTSHNVKLHMFNHAVQEREKELMDKKRVDIGADTFKNVPTNISWLEKAVSPQPNSRLFISRKFNDGQDSVSYDEEGYVWQGDTQFFLKSKYGVGGDKVAAAIKNATDAFSRVRARPNNVIPTEPGYCFDGGIMVGGKKFYETAKAYYQRPDTPGAAIFGIEMRPTNKLDKDKLLDRVPFLTQMMGDLVNHTKTLRRGDRPLAGLDGQEMLTRIDAEGITAYYFIWEAQGKLSEDLGPQSTLQPNTHIELRIGGEPNKRTDKRETSELSEEEALALWDAMLNSFHVRPGAI